MKTKALLKSCVLALCCSAGLAHAAEFTVQYEIIARSGSTVVPGTSGTFNGFGAAPAIDEDGNVVFTGGGGGRAGVYTDFGYCCDIVADTQTPIPGGGGATFYDFSGAERHDIDGGRVAFTALVSPYQSGVFSNVGQSSPSTLQRIATEDDVSWSELGDPWVDGDTVAIYGVRPAGSYAILEWNGATLGSSLLNPGAGYNVAYDSQASISGNAAAFLRYNSSAYQMALALGSSYEVLATADVTPMPGMGGDIFRNFYHHPVVDRSGMDAAFMGYGDFQGVFKRVDGGALQHVADNSMFVPGSSYERFSLIDEASLTLANGQVAFQSSTTYLEQGIYTDIGGLLTTLVDTGSNDTILVNGQSLRVSGLSLGTRGLSYGPDGYMMVFRANLATGGSAIIRATISDGTSGGSNGTFTVYKDFSDNSTTWVSISLSCSSGTVTNSPRWAREGTPAVFTVENASAGTTCTATEPNVPAGYTKNESDCRDGDPLNGSCTIVNTKTTNTTHSFTVRKDFSDNNPASVSVSLSCTSGTVTNNPQLASESQPAVFSISGATTGATCTAVEGSVPSGYSKDESDCQDGDPLNGSCTIVNTLDTQPVNAQFTVYKDFSDDNSAWVYVRLTCTSGTVTNSPRWGREGTPIVFEIDGATAGTTCTAEELRFPDGYTKNESNCQNRPVNGSCTIVNTLGGTTSNGQFTVFKDFSDNNAAWVSISASCSGGTVTNSPQWAREGTPAVFTVENAPAGTTCTATEPTVPAGYTKNEAGCQDGDPLNGSCTIVNTKNQTSTDSFTVRKDFSDNNSASVSVSLTCSSGVVTNNPQLASETLPAVFSISGAVAGTTCTAVENSVPSGYTKNESGCQDGDPLNGSCTIVNTLIIVPQEVEIVHDTFESRQSEGWSLGASAVVTSGTSIGQYALRVGDGGGSSVRSVSTLGYTDVSIQMHIAADSLRNNEACYAQYSTDGGANWYPVVEIANGSSPAGFISNTVAPLSANNNSNLRLRYLLDAKGKGDYCWGDEIIVRGMPINTTAGSADKASASAMQSSAVSEADDARVDTRLSVYGDGGFDPGFDSMAGDGVVQRQALGFETLTGPATRMGAVSWSAFQAPAGAAQPTHLFEGALRMQNASALQLPEFNFEFVQVGNHLFPQSRVTPTVAESEWDYIIDTGRVWREHDDRGYSRAAIPFLLVNQVTGCVREGAATFLFDDQRVVSNAAVQVSGGGCAMASSGMLQAEYKPESVGDRSVGIQSVLACAADTWLPAVQGQGGITVMLTPDNTLQYYLSGPAEDLWIDAEGEADSIRQLCR